MNVFTARLPVLNAKLQIVAYQLSFRDARTEAFPEHIPKDTATAKLLVNSYLTSGLEQVTEGKPAFVSFPRSLMEDHLLQMVPYKNIIAVLEDDIEPNDENYILIRKMFHKRYPMAIDNFVYKTAWDRFFPFIKLMKFDIQQTPLQRMAPLIAKLRQKKIRLLAQNIQSYQEFELAKKLGFNFFQGDFLYTPQVVEGKEIETSQHFLLSIYSEVMKEDFNYNVLEGYFEKDMSLSYKLLRFVNSSLFDIKKEITSLKQAMIFLGEVQLRKFVCLIVTAELNTDKPKALVQETVIRARLCELFAKKMGLKEQADSAFLTGLFSTIDAILDKPMAEVLETLPLGQNIKDSILNQQGELYDCLQTALAYINGNWMVIFAFAKQHNLNSNGLIADCDNAYDWMSTFQSV